jgi:uncharacterized protein
MNIGFQVSHPSDVYLFKNLIYFLRDKGHRPIVLLKVRENIEQYLLDKFKIEYIRVSGSKFKMISRMIWLPILDLKFAKIMAKRDVGLIFGRLSAYLAHASFLNRIPFLAFEDSEPTALNMLMATPFADLIITPKKFNIDFGRKQLRIDSYKELAYLHPNHYKNDPKVLVHLKVQEDEKYVILRFNAFDSYHDIGHKGFSLENKVELIDALKDKVKVFISSEKELPQIFHKYLINIPPDLMHSAIGYAHFLIGDTQTSTTEAACLGTPAIRCNSFVGPNDMSNFIELEQKYGLIFNYSNPAYAIQKAKELVGIADLKTQWQKKYHRLIDDKKDLSSIFQTQISKYL